MMQGKEEKKRKKMSKNLEIGAATKCRAFLSFLTSKFEDAQEE